MRDQTNRQQASTTSAGTLKKTALLQECLLERMRRPQVCDARPDLGVTRGPRFEVREGGRNELKILFNDKREVTLCQDWNKVFWRKRRPISNIKIKGLTPGGL